MLKAVTAPLEKDCENTEQQPSEWWVGLGFWVYEVTAVQQVSWPSDLVQAKTKIRWDVAPLTFYQRSWEFGAEGQ